MRKILSVSLIISLIFILTACENTNTLQDSKINEGNIETNLEKEEVSKKVENTPINKNLPKNGTALKAEKFLSLHKELNGIMIDIRTPSEIALGKVDDTALEIDYYEDNFDANIKALDRTRSYFIYCAHGNRTRYTKNEMIRLGFERVYDLEGGIVTIK